MAVAAILPSKFGNGYYFPYRDEEGKSRGIAISKDDYDLYFEPGYLTYELVDQMCNGKKITFNVKDTTVTASVVSYINGSGKSAKSIKYNIEGVDEEPKIIRANLDKITLSYWNPTSSRFDYTRPQATIDSLGLFSIWKTYATYEKYGKKLFGTVRIYKSHSSKDAITTYCIANQDTNECIVVDEAKFKAEIKAIQDEEEARNAAEAQRRIECKVVKDRIRAWIEDLRSKILDGGNLIDNLNTNVNDVDVPDINDLVSGLINKNKRADLKIIFDNAISDLRYITVDNYDDPNKLVDFKNSLLRTLKIQLEYLKVLDVRDSIWKQFSTSGLEATVEGIDIDTALDLGIFKEVKRIMLKYPSSPEKAIIYEMYKNILDSTELRTKILNLLKVYFDFYNMPEKDRKSLAKFIVKHNLSDYYDEICKYEDNVEIIIDESKDTKLLKRVLTDIAGTPKADCLKDKTFYFEKRGRIRDNVIVNKPIELLDKLKECITEFNYASDVAILTNIELDSDESFIFQFYTFAAGTGDTSGFDGRRMLNLTRIYNRHNPSQRIGFNFDNEESETTDDE